LHIRRKKNTECEAAHTRFGGCGAFSMQCLMPCGEASELARRHHANEKHGTYNPAQPKAACCGVRNTRATFMWDISD
jgi:hypothetical protein